MSKKHSISKKSFLCLNLNFAACISLTSFPFDFKSSPFACLSVVTAILLSAFSSFPLIAAGADDSKKTNVVDEQAALEKEVVADLEKQGIRKDGTENVRKESKETKTEVSRGGIVVETIEQEIKEEPKKEEKKEINLNTAEIFALKEEYMNEVKNSEIPAKEKIMVIVKKYLAEAEEQYELKKKSGNVKGMAVSRDGKTIFSACLESLEKEGKYSAPEKFRKELSEIMDKFLAEVNPITEEMKAAETAIAEKYPAKFAELLKPQIDEMKLDPENSEKITKEKYDKFIKEEIKPPEEVKKSAGTEPAGNKEESPVIGSKGVGDTWIDVGEWHGDMFGMDVVNIKLNSPEDYTEKQFNPMSGEESILTYKVFYPVPPRSDYAFRLMRIPDKFAPDILEWPSPSNNMSFSVRTKPIAKFPALHGFLVQVSLPAKEAAKLFNKKDLEKRMALKGVAKPASAELKKTDIKAVKEVSKPEQAGMKISFSSKPEGANIYVDNFLQNDQNGNPCVTPCVISVPLGKHNIKMAKIGYVDKIFPDYNIAGKPAKLIGELLVDSKLKSKKLTLGANASSAKQSGLSVVKGEKIVIDATGTWGCGERGDKCGPEGYENNKKFYKYYMDKAKDLRVLDKAPYGALLFKIGKEGAYMPALSNKEIIAAQDGEIYVDINEKVEERKGNSGSIELNILIFPKTL